MDEELKRKVLEQVAGYRAAGDFILEEQRRKSPGRLARDLDITWGMALTMGISPHDLVAERPRAEAWIEVRRRFGC